MRQSSHEFAVSKGRPRVATHSLTTVDRTDGAAIRHHTRLTIRFCGWCDALVVGAAVTIGACSAPSSLAPAGQAALQISTDGRLERGSAIVLHVTRNGSPVTGTDVTWSTTSGAMVRLIDPDTAVLADSGTVSVTAHVGAVSATTALHVAAPPMIVFAMHDIDGAGTLGNYNVYRAALDGQQLTRLTSGAGDNDEPTVANGVVVFTSYRDGYPALYRVPLAGGAESRLAGLSGTAFQAALSPDGLHLAFIAPDSGDDKLWIAAPDGSGASRPTQHFGSSSAEEASPAWAPANDSVVFVSTTLGNAAIIALAATTDSAQAMTDGSTTDVDPAWSPDGGSVAFASTRDGDLGIFVLTVATGTVRRVSPHPSNAGQPSWLADGRIVYTEESSTPGGIISQLNWVDPTQPGLAHVIATPAGNPENAHAAR